MDEFIEEGLAATNQTLNTYAQSWKALSWRFSLYVLANTFIPPNNHDFASLRRCSFTRNHAK